MADLDKVIWPGWETVKLIGRGSFGSVYEIERNISGSIEKAALKVISIPQNEGDIEELYSDGYDEESITSTFKEHLKSIVAEYSLMRKMSGSANVVNCDDVRYVQHDDGIGWDVFIRMELLTPLVKSLPEKITEDLVIKLAKDICGALELCKKYGIIHRDIKPQNIFISQYGEYKLGDFGIAKAVEKTMGGTKTGTYKYMAPEVYNNKPYGSATDIYSLGLVLYYLLNERRLPFSPLPPQKVSLADEENARRRRFEGEEMPPPLNGSEELKQIVLKACAFDPKDRYASATEMLEALMKLDKNEAYVTPVVVPIPPNRSFESAPIAKRSESLEHKENENKNNSENINSGTEKKTKSNVHTSSIAVPKITNELKAKDTDAKATDSESENKTKKLIIISSIIVIIFIIILLLLNSCSNNYVLDNPNENSESVAVNNTSNITPSITPSIVPNNSKPSVEKPESVSSQTTTSKAPMQKNWSEWKDTLPEHVNTEDYLIEEQVLYRSKTLETTSSNKSELSGWELYDTKEGNGGFGNWSDWSSQAVNSSETREVETQIRYRYKTKETTTSSSVLSDWELYDTTYSWSNYGSWSDWSTSAVTSSESRKVETKTQYRTRTVNVTQEYSAWSGWSDWSENKQNTSDLVKEESRTVYGYYCYFCSNCGAQMPYNNGASYGICYTNLGGCGSTTGCSRDNWRQTFLTTSWDDAKYWDYNKYYIVVNGVNWFVWDRTSTQYRYSTRTLNDVVTYGSWSSYSDTMASASSSLEVQTRTVYRYCDREKIPTYHYYRWSEWSGWSTSSVSANDNCKVEKQTYYRYRERLKEKTYYFKRWTDWSDYSKNPVEKSDTVQVETKTQYRYKSR